MDIVTAGMHNGFDLSSRVSHFHLTRVRQPGLFEDWQCVHVSAQKDSLARAIVEDGGKAMAANILVYGVWLEGRVRSYNCGGG